MADVDPLEPRDITGTHIISDRDAEALYHSNIAMDALSEERLVSAWGHAVRALQLNPQMAHLWVNLGAVYRVADQHLQAERSYLHALQLDPRDRSAMNNLTVLYGMQGRTLEQEHWQQQLSRYQQSNPYYHAWQGDKSAEANDWRLALKHYQRALALGSDDSRLLYATGLIYYQLEEYEAASRLIMQAIQHATLRSEINSYQIRLDAVTRDHLAGL
jgi:Flp pilus assembly protein TadD